MNKSAEKHLAKARDYVARGEEFYRKASEEIIGAQKADASLGIREIADELGMSKSTVSRIVRWSTSVPSTGQLPASEPRGAVAKRHARSVLRDAEPEQLREIMDSLPVERRAEVVRAAVPPPEQTPSPRTGPTFIDLLVRINSALIELEAMVANWQNPAAVPAEFSRDSFNDIVAKSLRIQDHFDALVSATDDEDEFQKIVRNFRVASDVG